MWGCLHEPLRCWSLPIWSGTKDKEERHQKLEGHKWERDAAKEKGGEVDPEKRDRDEWQIPVRDGQKTEKEEADTIMGTGRSRQKKKKKRTDFHTDRLSALSPIPKLCRYPNRVVLQWEGFREDLEFQL